MRRFDRNWIGCVFLLSETLLRLPCRNDEGVIFAVITPRARRHIAYLDESPIGHIGWFEVQIIADGRRNTKTCTVTCIRRWRFILKNVLEMVCAKRPRIFPLRVADAMPFSDGDPAIFAD